MCIYSYVFIYLYKCLYTYICMCTYKCMLILICIFFVLFTAVHPNIYLYIYFPAKNSVKSVTVKWWKTTFLPLCIISRQLYCFLPRGFDKSTSHVSSSCLLPFRSVRSEPSSPTKATMRLCWSCSILRTASTKLFRPS